jgi:RNA polymerase sigma factor (sigma-70 family)
MGKFSLVQVNEYVDWLDRTYRADLYKYVLSLMEQKDEAEAEDITQETIIRAYYHVRSTRDEFQIPLAWLRTVAKNLYVHAMTKGKGQRTESLEQRFCISDKQTSPIDIPDSRDTGPDLLLVVRERLEIVTEQIKALPKGGVRDVMALTSIGYTPGEISQTLQERPGTIRGRLSRGRARLEHLLASMEEQKDVDT